MIRFEPADLRPGLRAVAVRDGADVLVRVSSALGADEQRRAFREALDQARDAGWLPERRPGLVLVPVLAAMAWREISQLPGWLAWGTATAATATAVGVLATMPPSGPGRGGDWLALPPAPAIAPAPHDHHHRRPGAAVIPPSGIGDAATRLPAPSPGRTSPARPSPSPTMTHPAPTTSPHPTSSPTPEPSSSSPPPGGGGHHQVCVSVLGIVVCVGL